MDQSKDNIETFLDRIRLELLEAWHRGEDPLYCALTARGGRQIGNVVPTPLPRGMPDENPQCMVETVPDIADVAEGETTATEDAILEVLKQADKPIKLSVIARRAGSIFNSHFRQTAYELVKKKKIITPSEHRYWLADRPLPMPVEEESDT